jgi:hypothetical protein
MWPLDVAVPVAPSAPGGSHGVSSCLYFRLAPPAPVFTAFTGVLSLLFAPATSGPLMHFAPLWLAGVLNYSFQLCMRQFLQFTPRFLSWGAKMIMSLTDTTTICSTVTFPSEVLFLGCGRKNINDTSIITAPSFLGKSII